MFGKYEELFMEENEITKVVVDSLCIGAGLIGIGL
jgi:hypothetical protein